MSWIELTLRATNGGSVTYDPHRDVVIQCSGVPPQYEQHPDGERTPGAGGRKFQNIVQMLSWDLQVLDFTVLPSDWDHGHYESLISALRAQNLYIMSVTGSFRTNRDETDTTYDYWTDDPLLTILPHEVVATFDAPSYKPQQGGFGLTIRLESVLPIIGVEI